MYRPCGACGCRKYQHTSTQGCRVCRKLAQTKAYRGVTLICMWYIPMNNLEFLEWKYSNK